MKSTTLLGTAVIVGCLTQFAHIESAYGADGPPRPEPPVRLPDAPGTPSLTAVGAKPGETGPLRGAPGANPPSDADGDFLIGPDYARAAELNPVEGVPKGVVRTFTMRSEDSRIYPGVTKVPPGGPPDYRPPDLSHVRVYAKPYARTVTVYVPAQYVPGAPAPVIVTQDGPDKALPTVLDNLIARHRVPAMVAVMIQNGGGDAQGSERGLEYDTMSGRYAEFIESEVFPLVERNCGVVITRDPEGRAAMGGSSGGAAAFTMAWYHPELCHRVITYSGTYVNQASPFNPDAPHGAWEYHERLIAQSPRKPIRVWLEVGDRDLFNPNSLRDGMHDWVEANNRMATALKAKGYHYQYVFALNARHTDRRVREQTLPEALEWVWRDYKINTEPYAIVFLRPNPERKPIQQADRDRIQAAHMANIHKMADDGIMVAAGPMDDRPTTISGIFVFKIGSLAEARRIAALDPTVVEHRNTVDVHWWLGPAGIGSGYFRMMKDDPAAKVVMASHEFCILKPGPASIGGPPIALEAGRLVESLRSAGTLAAGGLTEEDADIAAVIVFRNGSPEEAMRSIDRDPAIVSGRLAAECHTWWCADRVLPW